MKKFKSYVVYLENGGSPIAVHVPATSAKDARKYAEGNGEILAVKDAPGTMPSADKVVDAMKQYGCSQTECDMVMRLINQCCE